MFSPELNPGLGRSGRVLPKLETLEDRCCPSTVSLNALTHLLTLTGDASNSTVVVRDDGHGDVQVYGLAGAPPPTRSSTPASPESASTPPPAATTSTTPSPARSPRANR